MFQFLPNYGGVFEVQESHLRHGLKHTPLRIPRGRPKSIKRQRPRAGLISPPSNAAETPQGEARIIYSHSDSIRSSFKTASESGTFAETPDEQFHTNGSEAFSQGQF